MSELEKIPVKLTDEKIADRAIALLTEAAQVLTQHSTDRDYHMSIIRMAASDITSAARMLNNLKGPIPEPVRPLVDQGPRYGFRHGPRRFKVEVRFMRPAKYEAPNGTGGTTTVEIDEGSIKKAERARFFNYGSAAAQHAEAYAFHIGDWVESVRITDRQEHVMWTYDSDANCVEIPFGEQ